MKKTFAILVSALLVLGLVVQARAAFESGTLTLSLYKSDDADVGHSLGINLSTFDFATHGVLSFSVEKTAFTTNPAWADLRVGIYGYTGNYIFFATTEPTPPTVVSSSWLSFRGATDVVLGTFYGPMGTNPAPGMAVTPGSYWYTMDSHATPGQYAGFNMDHLVGEATLEALDQQGSVTMYLYKYERVNREAVFIPGSQHPYQCEIRISAGPFQPWGEAAPVIADIPDESTPAGVPYEGPTPELTAGTLPVTWTLVAGPAGMTIDPASGVVSWDNPVVEGSPFTVTIRATNSYGSDEESWALTVTNGGGWAPASTVGATGTSHATNYLGFLAVPLAILFVLKRRSRV